LSLAARGIQPSCFQRVVSLTMMRFLCLRMHEKRDVTHLCYLFKEEIPPLSASHTEHQEHQ